MNEYPGLPLWKILRLLRLRAQPQDDGIVEWEANAQDDGVVKREAQPQDDGVVTREAQPQVGL